MSRTGTIGDGWSPDAAERARQMAAQEALVSAMAEIEEEFAEWELEAASREYLANKSRND